MSCIYGWLEQGAFHAGLCGILLCSIPFHVGEVAAIETNAALEMWAYVSHQDLVRDSVLNPGNRVANLPETQWTNEVRLNVSAGTESTDIVLRPRILSQLNQDNGDTGHSSDTYLSQGFARLKIGHPLTLTAGRDLFTWGPANFRSPSNPFYFDAGRTQPLLEISGIDLVRLHYADGRMGATGAYVFDAGHQIGNPDYRHTALLKVDYRGSDYLVSGIGSQQRGYAPFYGAFVQFSQNDALLLYGEFGSGQRALALQPSATPFGIPYQLQQPSTRAQTSLLGASYTLLNGQVLSLEYLHDGHGYSLATERQYFQRASDVASQLAVAQSGPVATRALGSLQQALGQAPALLGRDYLFVLWQSNPQEASSYWRAMWTSNVLDHSSQLNVYVEKNVSPHISVFGAAIWNTSRADTEYGALQHSVVTLGAKLFVF